VLETELVGKRVQFQVSTKQGNETVRGRVVAVSLQGEDSEPWLAVWGDEGQPHLLRFLQVRFIEGL
jgi:hypothetical protein